MSILKKFKTPVLNMDAVYIASQSIFLLSAVGCAIFLRSAHNSVAVKKFEKRLLFQTKSEAELVNS